MRPALEDEVEYYFEFPMTLSKIKTDGTDKQSFPVSTDIAGFFVVEDWLYYWLRHNSGYCEIYRMKTDGSAEQLLLASDDLQIIGFTENWIYYANYTDSYYTDYTVIGSGLYRISTDGILIERIKEPIHSWYIYIADDWIYFSWLVDYREYVESSLYRMKTDGSITELLRTISSARGYNFDINNIDNEWIYYADAGSSISRSRMDGTDLRMLSSDSTSRINIVGDWMYYYIYDYTYVKQTVRTKTDGSYREIMGSVGH